MVEHLAALLDGNWVAQWVATKGLKLVDEMVSNSEQLMDVYSVCC